MSGKKIKITKLSECEALLDDKYHREQDDKLFTEVQEELNALRSEAKDNSRVVADNLAYGVCTCRRASHYGSSDSANLLVF